MAKDVKAKDGNVQDETLLLVSGCKDKTKEEIKEYVKSLSNAILQTLYKHGKARLRGVGAGAGNNADKAIIIAKGESQKRGDRLLVDLSFTTVNFGGDLKTGILKEVIIVNNK